MKPLRYLLLTAVSLALFVVMLGAYTRLTDAGLGCPDWPGCYGQLVLPNSLASKHEIQKAFPETPLETPKAWTEMAHRYVAGTLGLLIGLLAWIAFKFPQQYQDGNRKIAYWLVAAVIVQAMLGMWTVTLKLLPIVVMAHLCGGIVILSLLSRLTVSCWLPKQGASLVASNRLVSVTIAVLFIQIMLGGWVSANYAGVACIGFPTCNGQWWPHLDFSSGFYLFSPVGANYQGGLLEGEARVTIQWIHRLWAVFVFCFIAMVFLKFKNHASIWVKRLAYFVMGLLGVQIGLGIFNVLYLLPLKTTVMHNGVGALLLASLLCLELILNRVPHDKS